MNTELWPLSITEILFSSYYVYMHDIYGDIRFVTVHKKAFAQSAKMFDQHRADKLKSHGQEAKGGGSSGDLIWRVLRAFDSIVAVNVNEKNDSCS